MLNYIEFKIIENIPEVRWDIILMIQLCSFLAQQLFGVGTRNEAKFLKKRKAKTFLTLVVAILLVILDATIEYFSRGDLTPGYFRIMINSYIMATSIYELGLFTILDSLKRHSENSKHSIEFLMKVTRDLIFKIKTKQGEKND